MPFGTLLIPDRPLAGRYVSHYIMGTKPTTAATWLTQRWQAMNFTHEALAEVSGLSVRTLARIHAGYAPARLAVTALMLPLAYGPNVREALLDGPIDPDELDALAAPVDALSRIQIVPPPYRQASIFFRRVGRGLDPWVRPGSYVAAAAGPVEDGDLALVEFRRGSLAVRFVARAAGAWHLMENPQGKGWREFAVERVKRVSRVLFEVRAVGVVKAVILWTAVDLRLAAG